MYIKKQNAAIEWTNCIQSTVHKTERREIVYEVY